MQTRRDALIAAAAFLSAPAVAAEGALRSARERISSIERRVGGRLGVAALDTGSGAYLGHRDEERFPMCSTFKLLAAAAVLRRVDRGVETLDRKIGYGPEDLLDYAPVTKAHVAEGAMSLGDLCAAALDWSDNTAANLILSTIGGPRGFTTFARRIGDGTTRLDRNEPTLNEGRPGDRRDTTSPLAMQRDLSAVLLGGILSSRSRRTLIDWLLADKVGDTRLRAGVPKEWRVADKTGTGDHSANTIAAMWPPSRPPVLACVYLTETNAPHAARDEAHREIGALVARAFPG